MSPLSESWDLRGLVAGFSLGAVNVLDLKENVDNNRSPGALQILQFAGSSTWDSGFNASNSSLQFSQ